MLMDMKIRCECQRLGKDVVVVGLVRATINFLPATGRAAEPRQNVPTAPGRP